MSMSHSETTNSAKNSSSPTDPTRPEAPTKTWQPSTLDAATSNYSSGQAGRPAPSGTLSRPSRLQRPVLWFFVAAVVLAAAILVWRSQQRSGPVEPVAVLEVARGPVSLQPLGVPTVGTPVATGAVIETRAAAGAAVRLTGGQSVRIDAESRVRVVSATVLELERGALYIDSKPALALAANSAPHGATASVEVRTTLGVVRDIGTQFEVRLLAAANPVATSAPATTLFVRVREGSVELRPTGALIGGSDPTEIHVATAGVQLRLGAGDSVERMDIPVHGQAWDWVLLTAPIPPIEGQRLPIFLDWVTREGGWQLAYADPAISELATTVVLHGDVTNLTLTEAAATVLKSSSLQYRVESGMFIVEPIVEGPDPR